MAKKENRRSDVKINKAAHVKIRTVGKATADKASVNIKKVRASSELPHRTRQSRGDGEKAAPPSGRGVDGPNGMHIRQGPIPFSSSHIQKKEPYIQNPKAVIHKMATHINKAGSVNQRNQEEDEAREENRGSYLYPAYKRESNRKKDGIRQKGKKCSSYEAEARGSNGNKEAHREHGKKRVVIQKGRLPSFHGDVLHLTNKIRINKSQNAKEYENREDPRGKKQIRQKENYQENQKERQKSEHARTEKGDKTGGFSKKRMINTMKAGAVYQVKKAGAAMIQSPQQEEYRRKQWMESQIQHYGVAAIRKEAVWTGHAIKDIMAFAWKQIRLLLTTIAGAALPLFLPVLAVVLAVVLIVNVFSLLFTQHQQTIPQAVNVSEEVLAYRQEVSQIASRYDMSQYVELILAVMMQESGGRGQDPMQSSEGAYNTRYPRVPNGITDPTYSIECGIQELKYALVAAECTGPGDLEHIKLALQAYNFGSGYISWAVSRDGGYTPENAALFSSIWAERYGWSGYGDKDYVPHVLRYYALASAGNSNAIISEGMKYMGMPYVYGGSSPETSFDCSGFVYYVYNQCGYQVPRATAQGFYDMCVPITEQEAQPGDLVFFEHTYDFYERITHIGIYIGNGQMMHFGNPGKISPISSYGNKFVGYGRLPAATE